MCVCVCVCVCVCTFLCIVITRLHRAGRQLELSDCLNVDMIMSRATTEQLQSLLYGDEDITEEDSEILSKLRFKDNAVCYRPLLQFNVFNFSHDQICACMHVYHATYLFSIIRDNLASRWHVSRTEVS